MGTFEKTFDVDGASYDLFRHDEDGETSFELVDARGRRVGVALDAEPDQEAIERLVRTALRTDAA
jgi:hypothetical protein